MGIVIAVASGKGGTGKTSVTGGVAAALEGAKVAKSPKTRELCVAGMAKGMKLQQDARVTLQNMKEDAQDLCAEAKQKAAQETAEEA